MDNVANIILVMNPDNKIVMGIATPFGVVPMMVFNSLSELRSFAMGLLGYVEYFNPEKVLEIPLPFLRAFEEDNNAKTN